MPTADIPIICAAQSDNGTRFAARYADYNFCASFGYNAPKAVEPSVARLVKAMREAGAGEQAAALLARDPAADADSRIVEVRIKIDPRDCTHVARYSNSHVKVTIRTEPQKICPHLPGIY